MTHRNISAKNIGIVEMNGGNVTQNFIYQVSELMSGQAPPQQPLTQEQYRQRKVLLSKVKEYWVEGVLNKSLHTEAMIKLGLEKRSDAVDRPFSGFEKLSEASGEILPEGTDITQVFNQIGDGRTLLILGEPGAGKTITLLKLAQNLIARSQENPSRLIPVVFNLSSWGSKRESIADWLVQELWSKYQVPKAVGKSWVENQQLLLLLDGLDEVKADRRDTCVQAINQFMQNHGQTEMVVCSRIADYEVLSNRLQLRGAIYIRALTPEQVNHYLDNAGEQLGAVKTLLRQDTALQELAKSPLTLSIMTLAYYGKTAEELPQTGSIEARREHLFNAYIERMFTGKGINEQYPKYQTIQWLIWLAKRMTQASQSVFLIEQMQPTWLQTQQQKRLYRFGSMLVGGLLIVVLLWPIYEFEPIWRIIYFFTQDSNQVPLYYKGGLANALKWGIVLGLFFGWGRAEIKTVETLTWPWKKTWKDLFNGIISGLKIGIGVALVFSVIYGLLFAFEDTEYVIWGLTARIRIGTTLGLSWGLVLGLINALKGSEIEKKNIPNQGIWQSAINAGITGLISWPMFVPIQSLIHTVMIAIAFSGPPTIQITQMITPGLRWGLMLGLMIGGGVACVRHFTLRFILHQNNYIPWNYADFLDYATKRVFLKKVGGGYIFIHRMLLEHFARMR
ncbi:MAG: NACHT domain-containing NTPase [Crocosphaera sp.]